MDTSSNKITKCRSKRLKKLKKIKRMHILMHPQKSLEMNYCYKIGDVHIYDKLPDNNFTSLMTGLQNIKKVVSFTNDQEYGFITCNMLDNQINHPPVKLLIERLKTLGDIDAYYLSESLNKILHIKNAEKKEIKRRKDIENIFERQSYKDYLERTENFLKQFALKYPLIMWRNSNFENQIEFELFQMGFNHILIESLGYEPQVFGMRLLKKGLPDLLWIKKEYFKIMNQLVKSIFLYNRDEGFPEFFLKTETNYIATKHRDYFINKFEEEGFAEISAIEVLDINEKDSKLIKTDINNLTEKIYRPQLNQIEKYQNHHLLLENDNFKQETIQWIKKCYPKCKFTFLQNDEEEKNRRCGFKQID